jgi:protease-4
MRSFFKIFFASLLALITLVAIVFFIVVGIVSSASSKKPKVEEKSVLVIDLNQQFHEREQPGSFPSINNSTPGLYDVIRLLRYAKTDDHISGIYLVANDNENGYASCNELRNALLDFKTSKKFVIAHGDMMTQKAYFVANVADRIFLNPIGNLDW